ncbi:hypothetical protein F5B20DRAFT_147122 [Whalleya microplaca]|nr:hypothetical protein F5B20DRAFT_147122 [Whalleya microplaca]
MAELLEDRETTWFGFSRDSSGHPIFQDHGRFAAIMGESHTGEVVDKYPQLVSFIGETGAGKSTMIKLLIDRQDLSSPGSSKYCSPTTSSSNDQIPTTGDVHLYADPSTFFTESPLLFADCEGLNGGEAMPKALRQHSRNINGKDLSSLGLTESSTPKDTGIRTRSRHSSQRHIAWANNPHTKKREYTVAQLYPRILYAFSDCVVFVLRNLRSFESTVLDKLLQWGSAAIDKSLNQPVLPHVIIVINASENIDENQWDVSTATNTLLTTIDGAVSREPALHDYVQTWKNRGKEINNTKDLLAQYYASVTVIRMPARGSYMLMDEQGAKLLELIKARCAASHLEKKQLRMLANAEMLQVYLQAAYDHFTTDLESPFDFVKEALRHNPVPRNFEGNILNLAVAIKDHSNNEALRSDARNILLKLAPMLASCVMLDAARQRLLGTATRLLNDAYAELCIGALQSFADLHWPCEFRNPAHPKEHSYCCNVRSGHNAKGHQNAYGKIIGSGQYQSSLDPTTFGPEWIQLIQDSLFQLQTAAYELGQKLPGRTDLQITAILHRERINGFYSTLGNVSDFLSYSACFSCLRELPEYALPCGHVLCLPCVQAYGRKTSRTTTELSRCPLHVRERMSEQPWVVTTKPPYAGVRLLCLDGSGIRGIVELQVLRAIEKILGPQLPIHLFFDLITGTNTGGIIALGLVVRRWSVNETIEKFKAICREAFTPRELTGVPLFEALSSLYHGSKYKTRPLEKTIKKHFSKQHLFGGIESRHEMSIKVAVASMTTVGQQPVAFANYNRPDPRHQSLPYLFVRPGKLLDEMKVWEAARATFAVPPHFKPFQKIETKNEYIDGSKHHACPVWIAHHEKNLIWSDASNSSPDIMLSVGAGRNVRDKRISQGSRPSHMIPDDSSLVSVTDSDLARKGGLPSKSAIKIHFLDDYQRCDLAWDKFIAASDVLDLLQTTDDIRKYIRFSPELNMKIPKFDDIQMLDELEREADEVLQQNVLEIKEIAHRLVASTFFFDKELSSVEQTTSGYACRGSICCRFRNSSNEMKGLGEFFRSCLKGSFEPYFQVENGIRDSVTCPIVLTEVMIRDMHKRGYFDMEPIRIDVSKEHSIVRISLCLQAVAYPSGVTVLPISGFPRQLMSENGVHIAPPHPRSVLLNGNGRNSTEVQSQQTLDLTKDRSEYGTLASVNRLSRHSKEIAELPDTPVLTAELPAEEVQKRPVKTKSGYLQPPELEG